MNNLLNKGDVVKTSLSNSSLVLKVEGNDALLFTGSQFVVAHGVQKGNDKVFWNQGDYYEELPDNIFEKDNEIKERMLELNKDQGKGFSYEKFYEYVRNKMATIYQNEEGQYEILEDTQPLEQITPNELGWLTEEETLKYIYDNNLFEEMEKVILTNHIPHSYYDNSIEDKEQMSEEDFYKKQQKEFYESPSVSDFGVDDDTEMHIRMEQDEDDWELEQ